MNFKTALLVSGSLILAFSGCAGVDHNSKPVSNASCEREGWSYVRAKNECVPVPTPKESNKSGNQGGNQEGNKGNQEGNQKEKSSNPQVAKWGQTWTYEDGVKVTVTHDSFKVPDYFAEYNTDAPDMNTVIPIKMVVKVVNGSNKVIDPTMTTTSMSAGNKGVQSQCFSEAGINCGLDGVSKLLPGKAAVMSWGFLVPKDTAGSVVFEIAPGFSYDSALYEGSLK